MEKLTFVVLENYNNYFLINQEDIIKAVYLPDCIVFNENDIKTFKEKFGIDIKELFKKDESLIKTIEKIENDELREEAEEFIDELPYLPSCCNSIYCEDIISQEDLENIKGYIYCKTTDTFNDPEDFEDVMENYYIYWDGHNHRCKKIGEIIEIEAEEIEKWDLEEELGMEIVEEDNDVIYNKARYDYYKTYYNNKPVYFRIYVSFYQGVLPFLDKEWEITDYELLDAIFYNCVPYKELQEINIPDSEANAIWYEINNKLKWYLLEHKDVKPFTVKFLTDREHKMLFVDFRSLETKEYISFLNILNELGYILDFTKCCQDDVALIEKKVQK